MISGETQPSASLELHGQVFSISQGNAPQPITMQRVVKGIFVTRDWPFLFPVKCEMVIFFSRES